MQPVVSTRKKYYASSACLLNQNLTWTLKEGRLNRWMIFTCQFWTKLFSQQIFTLDVKIEIKLDFTKLRYFFSPFMVKTWKHHVLSLIPFSYNTIKGTLGRTCIRTKRGREREREKGRGVFDHLIMGVVPCMGIYLPAISCELVDPGYLCCLSASHACFTS